MVCVRMFMWLCCKCRLQVYDRWVSKQKRPVIVIYPHDNLKCQKIAVDETEKKGIWNKLHPSRKSRRLWIIFVRRKYDWCVSDVKGLWYIVYFRIVSPVEADCFWLTAIRNFFYRIRIPAVYLPNFYSEISNIFQNLTNKEPVPRERENPNGSIPIYQPLTCRVFTLGYSC
jgi:hypothetical protein